jgi:serine/threonine-protein kinase RsbW
MPEGFRVTIGRDMGGIARANAAFGAFAEAHAVPDGVRRGMNVALDELLTNTVSHGLSDGAGDVSIEVDLGPDRLTVTLSDSGQAFDPFGQTAPDTTLSVEDRPIGGLGIHLVRNLVDDVSYERHLDRNIVVLTKRFVAGATGHRGGETMEISTRQQGAAWVVKLTGNLDSVTSPKAQQELEAIVQAGAHRIAVDFSALDYISSAGLRVLLGIAKKVGTKGGALRTFGLNQTVREVFDISGFSTILPVSASESEALSAF